MQISGKCHCGNLQFTLQTNLNPEGLSIRVCGCSFCRLHGAKYSSDPNGSVKFIIRNPQQLNKYQFGTKTAEFLICKVCGVYLAAVMTTNDCQRATVNMMTTDWRDSPWENEAYKVATQVRKGLSAEVAMSSGHAPRTAVHTPRHTASPLRDRQAQPVDYDQETQQERIQRRLANWTRVDSFLVEKIE